MAPGMSFDDVFIDGLPVGSVFAFVWNALGIFLPSHSHNVSTNEIIHSLLIFPICRLSLNISPPHHSCSQKWFSSRSWHHSCSIRFLHAINTFIL